MPRSCSRSSTFRNDSGYRDVPPLNVPTQTVNPLLCSASEMVVSILNGRQPEGVTRPKLMEPCPVAWIQQTGWTSRQLP